MAELYKQAVEELALRIVLQLRGPTSRHTFHCLVATKERRHTFQSELEFRPIGLLPGERGWLRHSAQVNKSCRHLTERAGRHLRPRRLLRHRCRHVDYCMWCHRQLLLWHRQHRCINHSQPRSAPQRADVLATRR